MAKLPYSRVVNVTMSRNDAFPSRRGFGVALLLTSQEVEDKLDASHLTRVYGSLEEVAVDFSASDEFYKAALAAFSQNPRPMQVKAGFVPVDTGFLASDMKAALDAIYDVDQDWYWIGVEEPMRDEAYLDGLVEWTQAHHKFALIDSNDAGTINPSNTTSIAARHKGIFDRTGVFWHPDADEYGGFALAAMLGTFNFDDAGSAYTAKFKRLAGVSPVNIGSAGVQAVTGFTPQIGQSKTAGHCANTYVDIGGRNFVVEGSTLTPNVFIDEIHSTDWIIARTEEEALGILLNAKRVAFTDVGMEQIASAARTVMQQASRAGIVADDLNPLTGLYEPAVVITVPSVFDVPEAQRKARVAPAISVRFRYAGAVHYTTINYNMTF
jgi:hypothetical protein